MLIKIFHLENKNTLFSKRPKFQMPYGKNPIKPF